MQSSRGVGILDAVTTASIKIACQCGAEVRTTTGWVSHDLLFHMINSGCISVGEARVELQTLTLRRETQELLASWVLDRAEQGDHWRAGDPERLSCGCVVSYDREQVDTQCETSFCILPKVLVS